MIKDSIKRHSLEWEINSKAWEDKKELREAYEKIYREFKSHIQGCKVLEIGSGMAKSKLFIPNIITSDREPNPWIDRVESAYNINSSNNYWDHIIMLDVWHHIERPIACLKEMNRVLKPGGTLLLIEPDISLLGWLVYGLAHKEPIDYFKRFSLVESPPKTETYYARQSSAHRMFLKREEPNIFKEFEITKVLRLPMISYVLTGGFSGPNLLKRAKKSIINLERVLTKSKFLTKITSVRLLVELKKK